MIEPIRNELLNFALGAIDYVRIRMNEVPQYSVDQHLIDDLERGTTRIVKFVSKDYSSFLVERGGDLRSLPEFSALVRAFSTNPQIKLAFRLGGDETQVQEELFSHYLFLLVSFALRNEDQGQSREGAVNALLDSLDAFVGSQTFTLRISMPLWNVRTDVSELDLGNDLYIRRLSPEQIERLVAEHSGHFAQASILRSIRAEVGGTRQLPRLDLRLFPDMPSAAGRLMHRWIDRLKYRCNEVVKSLRLLKPGDVTEAFVEQSFEGFCGPILWTSTGFKARLGESAYHLLAEDGEKIRALLPHFRGLDKQPRFALAMRRFEGTYEKVFAEDRLIDFWIALESLFVPDGGAGEVILRAAIRLTHFLNSSYSEGELFSRIKGSYRARSQIVHGTKPSVEPELVSETEDWARQALRRMVTAGLVPDQEMLSALLLGRVEGI